VAEAALFVLGLYLSVRVVAALFRIVDLWYRIGDQWPRVSRGIAAWGGIAAAIALTLDGRRRTAFLCGLAAYVVIHVLVYVSTQVYVWMQYRSRRRA
jgi:hypothetical protein